ncbi:MAG: acetate--CoA ligase family protein [Deltaproteobacteria bacterium]|nr:acetate--CoA ligase family protein [Deltaproteobacteria bacterium]
MDEHQKRIARLDGIFKPESIAIVGLPRGMKTGKLFLMALKDQGYPGPIYPVHPEAREIDGLTAYPALSAIPGPVDLAIILVPHSSALPVVRECAAKGVKGAVLFTAGYKETGTDEGKALEAELTAIARDSGMRLFGPNCMGIYCPESHLSFFPELSRRPGPVGFISHSGSLGNIICRVGPRKGICFSKVVSLGNECDLTGADLLEYLADDPATRVIGAYLEGIKDGSLFLKALKGASKKKPVILWKVGLTPEGEKAAASHTGAMGGARKIWEAIVRQGGAIPVKGLDVLLDTLMGFSLLPSCSGDRIAVISGPGGLAVAAAEACGNTGLRIAELSPGTRSALAEFVPPTGTSLANPVDVGLTASLEIDIYTRTLKILAADPGVDAIVTVGRGMTPELNDQYVTSVIETRRRSGKPLLAVDIPGFDLDFSRPLCRAGVPFFDTVERALSVYAQVRQHQRGRNHRNHRG